MKETGSSSMPDDAAPPPLDIGGDGGASSLSPCANKTDHFLPVSRRAIIAHILKAGLASDTAHPDLVEDLLDYFEAWRHQSYRSDLLRLKKNYLPFSPDRDTVRIANYSERERDTMQTALVGDITKLLVQANYKHINETQLNALLACNSAHGLELSVDLNEYDEMLLFSRGESFEEYSTRPWTHLYLKKVTHQVPIFQRLFLLIKLKPEEERVEELMDTHVVSKRKALRRLKKIRKHLSGRVSTDYIYLKMFKNIPQEDLEMMFPNTEVRFRLWDKIKLSVTAGGGTIGSIVSTAGGSGKALAMLSGGLSTAGLATAAPMALASAVAGLSAVIYRQVTQFFTQRTKYMMELANRLYFHALADNRAAITLLADRAEEEDVKEDMLLYFFLLRHPVPLAELQKMDEMIEQFLRDEFKVEADFDIDDAVERLLGDGVIRKTDAGMLEAKPPKEARDRLQYLLGEAIIAPKAIVEDAV